MTTSRNIETTKQQTLSQDFEQIVKALVYGDASVSLEYIENFAATVTGASLVVIYQAIQSSNVIAMIENAPVEFSEQASRAFKILDTIIAQAADEEPIEMSRARIKNMLHAVTDKAPFAAKVLAATAVMGAITTLPAHAQSVDSGTDTSSNSNHRATTVLITQNDNTSLISDDGNPSDSNQPQTSIYIVGSGNPSDGTYQETQKPEVVARPAYPSDQIPAQYDIADGPALTEQSKSSSDNTEPGSVTVVDLTSSTKNTSEALMIGVEIEQPPSVADLVIASNNQYAKDVNAQAAKDEAEKKRLANIRYDLESSRPFEEGKLYHRFGRVSYAFENSPEGIKYAIKHGYDRIDLDLQVTKDGFVVVTHTRDPLRRDKVFGGFKDTSGKITDRKIEISEMTLEEVQRLKHADGYTIHTLEKLIKVADNKITLFLELKTPESLIHKLPEITEMLNKAKQKATIGGIIRHGRKKVEGQEAALEAAQKLGFWVRKIYLGAQKNTWHRPLPATSSSKQVDDN